MTKLEAIARAMWEQRRAFVALHDIDLEEWGDGSIPLSNGIMEEARAAVKETGKLYNPILKAGATALVQRTFGCPPDDEIDAGRILERMMYAILTEKP